MDLTGIRASQLLPAIDALLSLAALIVALVVAARMVVRSRTSLLSRAPQPIHRFGEDAVVVAVFSYLLAYTLVLGVASFTIGSEASAPMRLLSGSAAQVAGTAVCLGLAARRFEGGVRRFWYGDARVTVGAKLAVTAATTVLALGVCPVAVEWGVAAMQWLLPGFEARPHPTIESLRDPGQAPPLTLLLWISAALIAPLAEEVFFRGVLQSVLRNVVPQRWMAIGGAALAFALVHFSQPYALPALFILAVLIGFAYERTGSLLPPFILHAVFNLKTLVWDALSGTAA